MIPNYIKLYRSYPISTIMLNYTQLYPIMDSDTPTHPQCGRTLWMAPKKFGKRNRKDIFKQKYRWVPLRNQHCDKL